MKINLTKLLEAQNYTGKYGKTNWVGILSPITTVENVYAFELEE